MHIIVVGAGEVGSYVADSLSREGHDMAVVEQDRHRLRDLQSSLDALALYGSGTSPRILRHAGVEKADLLVAVTNNDEVNLISSLLAKQFGVAKTIVRLQSSDLRSRSAKQLRRALGVDVVIDPDRETADAIFELLEFPGASEVAQMAEGEVIVIGVRLPAHAPLVGLTLEELGQRYEPEWGFLIGAISRENETIIPRGNHHLEANDHIWVVCQKRSRKELMRVLGLNRPIPKDVVLLGGGHTAEVVAERLGKRGSRIVLVERDEERCTVLAERLDSALVLQGQITDPDILKDERVEQAGAIVALTGEDDANILACIAAKSAGVPETIAVVHRLELLPIVHQVGIDVALSPRTATANAVLRFVRGGGIASKVETFLEGEVEILELETEKGSFADGKSISNLELPKNVLVGAIVRDGNAQIARGRSVVRARDRVILFGMPESIETVKRIFR